MNINELGFLRVAASAPKLKVADCDFNSSEMKAVIENALKENVQILCFPELSITSYSCGDLFFQQILQRKALSSLIDLSEFVKKKKNNITVIVGLPLKINNKLFNVAAVLSSEGIIGIVPKTYLANSNEFQEKRWFYPGTEMSEYFVDIENENVPVSSEGMIFNTPYGNFGIEICEDLWSQLPPSSEPSMQSADIIFNLSASNELIGKYKYCKSLVLQQSARCNIAYVYASAGVGESTTDLVFSGAGIIAENGSLLAESKRFSLESEIIVADIDVAALRHNKMINTNISSVSENVTEVDCMFDPIYPEKIYRNFNPHPFIPAKEDEHESLEELFNILTHGLAKRLLHTGIDKAVIGISGGLDSTLALLVVVKTYDLLGYSREKIHGITMPGLGTTNRTYTNAVSLMKSTGVTIKEISIVEAVKQHFNDIGHNPDNHDITYENSQARERTQILMDYANMIGGLVVGTGNMSELALGWTTYNGDQMSMYGVNSGVPKTLVATLVRWIADIQLEETPAKIVYDILETPFSPELLPADSDGKIAQKTEHVVGPYELHDFFLHRMIRYGDNPKRILFMAQQAFTNKYSHEEILKWLKIFYKRFFSQQFKRSCIPDSPKVGSVNLSPRSTWRMPSDALVKIWIDELE